MSPRALCRKASTREICRVAAATDSKSQGRVERISSIAWLGSCSSSQILLKGSYARLYLLYAPSATHRFRVASRAMARAKRSSIRKAHDAHVTRWLATDCSLDLPRGSGLTEMRAWTEVRGEAEKIRDRLKQGHHSGLASRHKRVQQRIRQQRLFAAVSIRGFSPDPLCSVLLLPKPPAQDDASSLFRWMRAAAFGRRWTLSHSCA
jgi:hypothetical protein